MRPSLVLALFVPAVVACSAPEEDPAQTDDQALEADAGLDDESCTADDFDSPPLMTMDFGPRAGSVTPVTLAVGPITLPEQFVTPRIGITPTVTCSLTPTLGYSAAPAANGQISVTLWASVTGTCYVQVNGQRYGIIHPTIDGDITISVTISGSATLTSGLDCSNIRAFTPNVSVALSGQVSYTQPNLVVRGRCGRVRPILTNIANNQASQAAAQAAAQVQQAIDAQLASWQTTANDWLAQQVPAIAGAICGTATAMPDAGAARVP